MTCLRRQSITPRAFPFLVFFLSKFATQRFSIHFIYH